MRAARFSDLAFALILMSFVFLAVRAIADGTWPEVGPGLLVGLVAGTVGWHYYQNIFAGIRAAELSRLVEFSIRINAVFFALPTLMAYLLDPRHWPVATAIGVASVSLNAWVCGRLCDRVAEKMRKDSRVTPAMDAARRALGDWGPLTAFYVVWLLCTEYGLTTGLLQDAWWYALTVSLLNAKMGIWNSTKEARLVRTGLARFISGLRRVNSPADAPTGAAMEPTLATAR